MDLYIISKVRFDHIWGAFKKELTDRCERRFKNVIPHCQKYSSIWSFPFGAFTVRATILQLLGVKVRIIIIHSSSHSKRCNDSFRWIQLLEGGADLQAGVLLLLDHHLRPLLHARHRLVGQLLARPERDPGSSLARGHHPAHHVHTDFRHQRSTSAGLLHEGHRCLDRGKLQCQAVPSSANQMNQCGAFMLDQPLMNHSQRSSANLCQADSITKPFFAMSSTYKSTGINAVHFVVMSGGRLRTQALQVMKQWFSPLGFPHKDRSIHLERAYQRYDTIMTQHGLLLNGLIQLT